MEWSEKIADRRRELRLSQAEVGQRVGLNQQRIAKWEAGEGRLYMDQAFALARALGLSLDYLADDEMDEPPAPELTADERAVIDLMRALGVSKEGALRALAVAVREEAEADSGMIAHSVRPAPPQKRKGGGV